MCFLFEIGLEENESMFSTFFKQAIKGFFRILICSLLGLSKFNVSLPVFFSAVELAKTN